MTRTRLRGIARGDERGFTIVELFVTLLVFAVLVAAMVPKYIGYTRDARLAEGKAVAASAMKVIQGCAQSKGLGASCVKSEIVSKVGTDPAGTTGDGRWTIATATMSLSGAQPPTFTGAVTVSGAAGRDTDAIALALYSSPTGMTLRCKTTSLTPPTSATDGDPC